MPLALDRGAARGEVLELTHRAEAAAPFPGTRGILAQFVASHPQREVALDILDRVVAGIGIERVDRIHAVEPAAPAIAALEDLHVDPVAAAPHAGKGDDLQIADPGRDLAR